MLNNYDYDWPRELQNIVGQTSNHIFFDVEHPGLKVNVKEGDILCIWNLNPNGGYHEVIDRKGILNIPERCFFKCLGIISVKNVGKKEGQVIIRAPRAFTPSELKNDGYANLQENWMQGNPVTDVPGSSFSTTYLPRIDTNASETNVDINPITTGSEMCVNVIVGG